MNESGGAPDAESKPEIPWPDGQRTLDRARRDLQAGDAGRAWPAYRALVRRLDELPDARARARIARQAAEAADLRGEEEEALRLADRALAEAERGGSDEEMAAVLRLRGFQTFRSSCGRGARGTPRRSSPK